MLQNDNYVTLSRYPWERLTLYESAKSVAPCAVCVCVCFCACIHFSFRPFSINFCLTCVHAQHISIFCCRFQFRNTRNSSPENVANFQFACKHACWVWGPCACKRSNKSCSLYRAASPLFFPPPVWHANRTRFQRTAFAFFYLKLLWLIII